jgi:hypothetical protein
MDIAFAFVCDYSDASAGKLHALGIGFDTIYIPQFPGVHRGFSLVVKLRANVVEAGQKDIVIRLIDADGNNVIPPINGQFTVAMREGQVEGFGQFALNLQNIEFRHQGPHSLHVVIQGNEMVSIPFTVAIPPSTA